jgi:GNAT superfamily N-acetyltransferase
MIRTAAEDDLDTLVQLIHDLARFEQSPDSVRIDRGLLHAALFGDSPTVFAHVAGEGGDILGMAIWFLNFSTWTGRNGIYLEDLYVRPEARGRGIGRSLIAELASIAHRSGYSRVEWSVLDWNEAALRFYRSLGAEQMDEWTVCRLTGPALAALADEGPPAG